MGFRRLTFLLSVTYALSLAACGDNKKPLFEDAMTDTGGDVDDAPIDTPDAPPDCGAAPNMLCNGTCTNTNTDNNNCGACGTACGTGETCTSGLCCTTGQTNCNGVCVDTTSDNGNCGGCAPPTGTGEVCDVVGGETCMNSTCCGGSNTACGNQCFDLQTDPTHCGDCATACGSNQDCSEGHCCADGFIWCNNACVDPNSDEANCGGCAGATGVVCGGSDVCDDGKCCAGDPILNCGEASCTNTDTDEAHCGACDAPCALGQECTSGKCCTAGLVSCDGVTCIDPDTNNQNCGGCTTGGGGTTCGAGDACDGGECCGPGEQNCGAGCVDVLDDFANCGACGDPCNVGEVCSNGMCVGTCGATETECPGGDCADLSSDHGNCGTCGNECAGNEVCNGGSCESMCDSGEMNCAGSCVDIQTDPTYCGSCSNQCDAGDVCSSGLCCDSGFFNAGGGLCCAIGTINCNGVCTNPTLDTSCGSCTNNCTTTPGSTCEPDANTNNGSVPVRCCPGGQVNCDGTCADLNSEEANCGACGASCPANNTCDDGFCCADPLVHCPTGNDVGNCTNLDDDETNCGVCGESCDSGETCSDGICCTDGTVATPPDGGVGASICCAPSERNCNGVCKNVSNDIANCGSCGDACGSGQICTGGECGTVCPPGSNTDCGFCTDTTTDENACGNSGPTACDVCAAGGTCNASVCSCPATNPTECTISGGGSACIDTGGVPTGPAGGNIGHCGQCGATCGAGQNCDDLSTVITTATASGTLATFTTARQHNLQVNDIIYVTGVGNAAYNSASSPTGSWIVSAVVSTTVFRATIIANNPANSTGGTVATGQCCGPGLDACPLPTVLPTGHPGAVCVDKDSDPFNCGGCGVTCGTGQTCSDGVCGCPFGTTLCGGACIPTSTDADNCGGCNISCGSGANTGKPFCVSNGCVAACPAPLTACTNGGIDRCSNLKSDNEDCGTCGNICPSGQGCVSGTCRPKLIPNPTLAKCVGGGPPIVVPDGDGGTDCTGNLGAVSFTFALCSRTNVGPLSQALKTDAFNSLVGPHVPSCTSSAQCGTGGQCVLNLAGQGTCVGGGVGINGTIGPTAGGSKTFEVGGDFWVMGMIGLSHGGDVTVKQRTFVRDDWDNSGNDFLVGDAFINGPINIGGSGHLTIGPAIPVTPTANGMGTGTLFTADTPCNNSGLVTGQPEPLADMLLRGNPKCSPAVWDNFCVGGTNAGFPCATGAECTGGGTCQLSTTPRRAPCGTENDLIDVDGIVEYFRDPARNDNKAIGLRYDALTNPAADTRVELDCGYYYFDSLGGSNEVTIVVRGRTAIFIGGSANINVEMIFDVEPTATLDIFVGGVIRIAHPITLGSPNFPRLTRLWIGSATSGGGGTACTQNSQCSSGICSACNNNADPNAVYSASCTGSGSCQSGANLSQAIDMSQGGYFNGLLWAGYGAFSSSNPVEMYGSIFANYLDASGDLKIHYDKGAVQNGECPPPPQGGSCESCRDCNNQACVNNSCGSCTTDSQCCPPFRCNGGTCVL